MLQECSEYFAENFCDKYDKRYHKSLRCNGWKWGCIEILVLYSPPFPPNPLHPPPPPVPVVYIAPSWGTTPLRKKIYKLYKKIKRRYKIGKMRSKRQQLALREYLFFKKSFSKILTFGVLNTVRSGLKLARKPRARRAALRWPISHGVSIIDCPCYCLGNS